MRIHVTITQQGVTKILPTASISKTMHLPYIIMFTKKFMENNCL